ncbi:hypothetical protein DM39_1745 [Burkholderia cenocepacia]|uniref:Uncharacterized protein n=1 Tax=Burkholderia cenocepacia TaxID=95486 RepID=A0AAN0RRP7_9BURK|nr:hypothetical protein DM39_1745 [Burkholderia cenocepacia]
MSLIAFGETFAATDHKMHLYWQGGTLTIPGYETEWEYLLELPVLVGKQVD